MQQILHMQRVDAILRIILDYLVRDQQRLVRIGRPEAVQRETTGKTSNRAEKTLKRLCHVMRNEVLINLHHSDDRLLSVRQ